MTKYAKVSAFVKRLFINQAVFGTMSRQRASKAPAPYDESIAANSKFAPLKTAGTVNAFIPVALTDCRKLERRAEAPTMSCSDSAEA